MKQPTERQKLKHLQVMKVWQRIWLIGEEVRKKHGAKPLSLFGAKTNGF